MASSIDQIAREFFEACETGRGWEALRSLLRRGRVPSPLRLSPSPTLQHSRAMSNG